MKEQNPLEVTGNHPRDGVVTFLGKVGRKVFLECATDQGKGGALYRKSIKQFPAQRVHGRLQWEEVATMNWDIQILQYLVEIVKWESHPQYPWGSNFPAFDIFPGSSHFFPFSFWNKRKELLPVTS